MALWLGKRAWRRVPWSMVWTVSLWLVEKGRERVAHNLTEKEQHELLGIVRRSKGRPDKLPQRDRTRLKHIAGKAVRG
jgi:hypothetical protein